MENEFFQKTNAERDELTGLYRRDSIMLFADYLITNKIPYTFAIVDIDNFKHVNDNYGHQMGDEVLKAVGKSLKDHVDGKGFVGRYGGDEFIFVFPYLTDYDTIWKIFFNILKSSYDLVFDKPISISYTMGAARYPLNTTNIDELFTLADKALYRGKVKGRNCFIIYLPEKHANIELQTIRDKVYSPIHLHAKIYNIITNDKYSLEENIVKALDFIGPYLLIDHLCLEINNELCYEYFQPISKKRDYKPFTKDATVKFLTENGVFFENTVNASKHINSPLYKEFQEQQIYAVCLCNLKAYGKSFGILRADMSQVDTGRIWQQEDLVLLEALANYIGMAFYIKNLKN